MTPAERRSASALLCRRIARSPWFRNAASVALYVAFDDEPDLHHLFEHVHRCRKQLLLPRVDDTQTRRMQMALARPGSAFRNNRYGIPEPHAFDRYATQPSTRPALVVVTPMSAFDAQCRRVGMGAGFYDRWFASQARRTTLTKIGVAFERQRVDAIDTASWDVPMDTVITERSVYRRNLTHAQLCIG